MDEDYTAWAAGCQQRLLASAYLITGDLALAEDLVQEALVKVALRWSRLRDGNPTAYARTIVARDHVSCCGTSTTSRNGRPPPISASPSAP